MSYAALTFKDRNPVKRWLQRARLRSALRLAGQRLQEATAICDFGGGNGELCKLIRERGFRGRLVCYEPAEALRQEATANLAGVTGVEITKELAALPAGAFDLIFCLEVMEHLPEAETEAALAAFLRLLRPQGALVIGVPVEVGAPALYKGLFRMTRRFGAFDARPGAVLGAALYSPPKPRPLVSLEPGLRYHGEHLGFDHRALKALLKRDFIWRGEAASPAPWMGAALMPEVSFLVERSGPGAGGSDRPSI